MALARMQKQRVPGGLWKGERVWLLACRGVSSQALCLPRAEEGSGSCYLLTSPLSPFSKGRSPCRHAQPFKTKFSLTVEKHSCLGPTGGRAFSEHSCFELMEKPPQGWPAVGAGRSPGAVFSACGFGPVGPATPCPSSFSLPDKAAFTEALGKHATFGREVAPPPPISRASQHPPKLGMIAPFYG